MFAGYILTFYTLSIAVAVDISNGDILNLVLTELSGLKVKVNACEERLAGLVDRDDQLKTAKEYEQKFADMESRLLAAEEKLLATEIKLNAFEKLHDIENGNNLESTNNLNDQVSDKKSKYAPDASFKPTKPFNQENATEMETNDPSWLDKATGKEELTDYSEQDTEEPTTGEISVNSISRRLLGPAVSHRVAFTAYLSDHVTGLGKQQTIPFDKVLLNVGQAFDPVLHAFICPVNGIYMFQSAVNCVKNQYMQTEMVKDGALLVRMYSSGATGSNGYDQGFNSAIVQCNSGERVWIRVHYVFGTAIFSWNYSSFSGYILWET